MELGISLGRVRKMMGTFRDLERFSGKEGNVPLLSSWREGWSLNREVEEEVRALSTLELICRTDILVFLSQNLY